MNVFVLIALAVTIVATGTLTWRLGRSLRETDAGAKTVYLRFRDPAGPEVTYAMGPGDALAWGGVRVDVHALDRIDVTPWGPEQVDALNRGEPERS